MRSIALVAVVACGPHPHYVAVRSPEQIALTVAGEQFAQSFVCPTNRVIVKVEPLMATPPADISADPERLALYNQQIAAQMQSTLMVSASGCGQGAMYVCTPAGDSTACAVAQRGRLGLEIFSPTSTISGVIPGGVGERLGFRVGDVFAGLDHQAITDLATALRVLNDPASPGHVLTVNRAGTRVDVAVPNLSALP
jgi:membrane-associated protease RseP (regulator of RpoE activity)